MCKTEEELKLEFKIKKEELKERLEELERVRCQSVVILARLEELEESHGKMRIEAVKKELES